jgi:glycosyltransferase involved in cell wall biosynthesis
MKMPTPRVSVGIPVYNGERYLGETIESILAQTFTDFELVISDNASTDRTEAICRTFSSRDPRIKYFRNQDNIGGSKNFARAFELSRAPYFKWAAHDDLCGPTLLENCLKILEENSAVVVCYPSIGFVDQTGAIVGHHDPCCNLRSPLPSERVRNFLFSAKTNCLPMFGLIRRDALKKTLLLAPYISSDQILLLQLALLGEFYEERECAFFFREHPDRSIWKYNSFAAYAQWHDPTRKSRIHLPRWRLAVEFFRSVAAADIPWHERRDCFVSVLKWCYWSRSVLARDLTMTARQIAAWMAGAPPVADMKSQKVVTGAAGFDDGDAPPASTVDSSERKETGRP